MSKLLREGGFAPVSALLTPLDLDSPYCAFCFRTAEFGWIHVTSQQLVCVECLNDPDAEDGTAGRRAQVRLRELEDVKIW